MIFSKKRLVFILVFWLLSAGLGLYKLFIRPTLPYSIRDTKEGVALRDAHESAEEEKLASAVVSTIDSVPISKKYELDNVVETKRIGNTVSIILSDNTLLQPVLIPRNDIWTMLINGFSGACCLIISLILMLYGKQREERYFCVFSYFLGLSLVITWPGMKLPFVITLLLSIVYFSSFSLGLVALLFFSLHFPSSTFPEKPLKVMKYAVGILGLIFVLILTTLNQLKIFRLSAESIHAYDSLYKFFVGFIFLLTLLSVASMIMNSRRAPNPINRRKIQWMIWGVLLGGIPFFVFWRMPQMLGHSPLIPEAATNLFLILGAACVTIAILKYRLFDIEIVLSRSLVYSSVIIILAAVYLLSIGGLSLLLFQQISLQSPVLSVLAAVLIAMLFNPLKNKVQGFVDRKFFRIRYDRFQSHQVYKQALDQCKDQNQILAVLGTHFQRSIPTKNQMFLTMEDTQWRPLNAGRKLDSTLEQWLVSKAREFFLEPLASIRRLDKIEADLPLVTAEMPAPWVIMIPIGREALWFLDQKKSGTRFWKEDLELASQMASSAGLEWEKYRLILQEQREAERLQTAKMESLRRLVAGTAHELNNPIGVISSSTDVSLKAIDKITESLAKDLPGKQLLETKDLFRIFELLEDANQSCKVAADKVATIVINLRRFVRLDEGEWQMADIHEGLDSVLALVQPEIENRIDIEKNYGSIPKIYCSPSSLNQVFMYLLKNAAEAIEGQGRILVKTSAAEDMLKIEIRDTGAGIPRANFDKIFDPGFTTKGVKVGVGLGLSISYHIIKDHNGSIEVESEIGQGSAFTIALPLQR